MKHSICTAAIAAAVTVIAGLGASAASAQLVVMEWVTIGNPGNEPDPFTGSLYGRVCYEYRIGKYEVTNAQYVAFLNAVAASDPNGLYNANMGSNDRGGITRSGSDGSYNYSVRANMADKPVNFVSWYDAARMANWMTNGQGSGGTESGVYTFTGPTSINGITRDLSNPNQVFIPTENEWYKTAYHHPNGYWLYATQSNLVPIRATATSTGDVSNHGANVVNYDRGANWNGQNGNVTTVGSAGNTSFYGAFDMSGNVWEWTETLIGSSTGICRGGASLSGSTQYVRSSYRFGNNPTFEGSGVGFRLASPFVDTEFCPCDRNGDGIQAVDDYFTFLTEFFAQLGGPGSADLDLDCEVTISDFFILLNCLPAIAASEACPGT